MIAKQDQTMAVLDDESQNKIMDSITNNEIEKESSNMACNSNSETDLDSSFEMEEKVKTATPPSNDKCCIENVSKTKIALSFSVDRLLNCENPASSNKSKLKFKSPYSDSKRKCCESVYSCCAYSSCLVGAQHDIHRQPFHLGTLQTVPSCHPPNSLQQCGPFSDMKSVVRPTPIRALGNSCDQVSLCLPLTSPLLQLHHQKQQQHQQQQHQQHTNAHYHRLEHNNTNLAVLPPLVAPLGGLKSLQINQHHGQHFRQPSTNFQSKAHNINNIPGAITNTTATTTTATASNLSNTSGVNIPQQTQQQHHQQQQQQQLTSSGKRKRSWSRAVFSNLQRKGLEIQFQQQKYITKPDRRKLAARLNLTDAQVKVWFQNRRMKWRHTRENLKSGQEKQIPAAAAGGQREKIQEKTAGGMDAKREVDYSSDASSSVEMSDNDEEEDEIDVVE